MKHKHIGANPFAPAAKLAEQVKRPIVRGSLRVRHAEMIAALVKSQPNVIRFVADARDMDERSEHIKAIGQAFATYIEELIDDTSSVMNTGSLDRDAHFQILDTIGDVAGQMSRVAEDLAEED